MKVTVHDSIADIERDDWNRLAGTEFPFLRHEFLQLAEATGCVSPDSGWSPRHLTIAENGTLRAAMPLYEKSSDIIINTDGKTPETVAELIAAEFKKGN